jgi:hypothetical protein
MVDKTKDTDKIAFALATHIIDHIKGCRKFTFAPQNWHYLDLHLTFPRDFS